MADLNFAYPAVLTKSAWDKNKGVMAKLAVGKTDVGAALSALEDAFKKSGFAAIKTFGGSDPTEYLAWEKGLVDGLTKGAAAVASKAGAAKVVAKAAHADFEKSKAVPKSSTAYVKSIVDAAEALGAQLTAHIHSAQQKSRDEFRTALKKTSSYAAIIDAAKTADATITKIMDMVKKVEAQPTTGRLHQVFGSDGPHRQLTTAFKLWDQLVGKPWPAFAKSIYPGQAMSQYFTLPGLADMANETNSTASKKLDALVKSGQVEAKVVTNFMLVYSRSVLKGKEMMDHIKKADAALKAI